MSPNETPTPVPAASSGIPAQSPSPGSASTKPSKTPVSAPASADRPLIRAPQVFGAIVGSLAAAGAAVVILNLIFPARNDGLEVLGTIALALGAFAQFASSLLDEWEKGIRRGTQDRTMALVEPNTEERTNSGFATAARSVLFSGGWLAVFVGSLALLLNAAYPQA